MSKLKQLFGQMDEGQEDEVEVFADSVRQGLELAANELGIEVSMLDYEILEKGTKGFLGMGREPYRLLVRPIIVQDEFENFDELEEKLSAAGTAELKISDEMKNADGEFSIRITKTGVWLTVKPPRGTGNRVAISAIENKVSSLRLAGVDFKAVQKEVKSSSSKKIKIGEWVPNVEYDGSMHVEVTEDEMKAIVHFVPPRFSGRHMDIDDVVEALKHARVLSGILTEKIEKYLEAMDYSSPLIAAEGTKPKHGDDAYIDYKVRTKNEVEYTEKDGQIDYKDLNLIENVVVGQVLAVKVPASAGLPGRTVTNRVLPTRTGKDTPFRHGKGTILSEDGQELTAEVNGQVVMKGVKLCVEEVLVIQGDVDMTQGNVVFLGSIMITGSVLDNFTVKAAGNIEVHGTVQKASLEAEGDIVVRQGINGRDEGKVESTNGSIYAKFVQRSKIVAEQNVVVGEEIVHSNVDAGHLILCNGRRAQIVGGVIRAGDEVNARTVGSEAYTRTEVRVGMNPKILQHMADLQEIKNSSEEEIQKIDKDLKTLDTLKRTGKLKGEKLELYNHHMEEKEKLQGRIDEVSLEIEELQAYFDMLEQKGKLAASGVIHPGVELYIKDQKIKINDPYKATLVTLEGKDWSFGNYAEPEGYDLKLQGAKSSRRR